MEACIRRRHSIEYVIYDDYACLQLREALDTYALKLYAFKDSFDQETYMSDYLSNNE
jgi:hypothetical protein